MLRDKWRRITVSAAGMAVELVLAALATLVWATTQPGLANTLALNVMFICSVGTLLINGNPLLRYDGYYVLADWLEAPNLQQQAAAKLRRGLAWLFAGVTLDEPRLLAGPGPILLWTYAIASLVYRTIVIAGILWFLDAVMRPIGLGTISLFIATIVLVAMAASPVAQAARFLKNPHSRKQIHGRRLAISLFLLAGILAALLLIPLPASVTAPVVTRPSGGGQVFVTTPGILASAVVPGQQVTAGQTIAVLINRRLELDIAELASRESQQQLHVAHLALRQHAHPEIADQLPSAEERLSDLGAQLAQKRRELASLTLTAPIAGTILPPPGRTVDSTDENLPEFSGLPQDPQNLGCFLAAGTHLATVAEVDRWVAVAIVEQGDLAGLREGQGVRIKLDQLPHTTLSGRVRQISRLRSGQLPPEILAERMIPMRSGPEMRPEPVHGYYQATIDLDPPEQWPLVGAVGWARIAVDPQPLWLRAYRGLRGTLRTPW
jgi:putative peptide zinc metalloprotease protein